MKQIRYVFLSLIFLAGILPGISLSYSQTAVETDQTCAMFLSMAEDSSSEQRAAGIQALQHCTGEQASELIRLSLMDDDLYVKQAAFEAARSHLSARIVHALHIFDQNTNLSLNEKHQLYEYYVEIARSVYNQEQRDENPTNQDCIFALSDRQLKNRQSIFLLNRAFRLGWQNRDIRIQRSSIVGLGYTGSMNDARRLLVRIMEENSEVQDHLQNYIRSLAHLGCNIRSQAADFLKNPDSELQRAAIYYFSFLDSEVDRDLLLSNGQYIRASNSNYYRYHVSRIISSIDRDVRLAGPAARIFSGPGDHFSLLGIPSENSVLYLIEESSEYEFRLSPEQQNRHGSHPFTPSGNWTGVETLSGLRGYIHSSQTRHPLDPANQH